MESEDLAKLWAIPGVLAVEVGCAFHSEITGRVQRCRRAN
jgi:hypothetical protein